MNKYMNANIVFSKFARDYMGLKKDLPVRPSEMAVINIITKREGDHTPLAIAERLEVSKPMITAHITSLEEKGYIFKEGTDFDKRSFYVRPTDKAKALAEQFEVRQTEILKAIEDAIGADEFERLVALLEQATNAMKRKEVNHE